VKEGEKTSVFEGMIRGSFATKKEGRFTLGSMESSRIRRAALTWKNQSGRKLKTKRIARSPFSEKG